MTIYYSDARVTVTTQWFITDERRYAVSDLCNMRLAQTTAERGAAPAPNGAALGATFGATLLVGLAAAGGLVLHWLLVSVMIVVLGAVAVVVGYARADHYGRLYELWADYRGLPVRMYDTVDVRVFGQVSRALVRAAEHARRQSDEGGVAMDARRAA